VLDAQNFGVAQRRRRVFVVGHLGDWKPAAEVLFESESLRGDIKKGRGERKDIANCLTKSPSSHSSFNPARGEGNGVVVKLYENHAQDSRVKEVDVCPTVAAKWGMGGGNVPLAMQGNLIGRDAGGPQGIGVSQSNTMYTLTKTDVHAVAFGWQNSSQQGMSVDTITPTLDKSKTPAVAFAQQPIPEYYAHQYCQDRVYSTEGITPALNCSQAHKFRLDIAVRRLTPVECERLQGFPDNYTNIPKAADGNRYKALGNSMAVPVMRWIGERINQYEQRGMEKHL
jgi:DNA (cytosine-5)-methyltransferase 1